MTLYFTTPHRIRRQMMNPFYPSATRDLVFPIDVLAEEDAYIVSAVLPGVEAEDLDIQVTNDVVTIKGEVKPREETEGNYLLRERPNGSFERSIRLPDDLDSTKTEASLHNGILILRIAKSEEAKPRSIKVNAG